jgi:hypothetical protein
MWEEDGPQKAVVQAVTTLNFAQISVVINPETDEHLIPTRCLLYSPPRNRSDDELQSLHTYRHLLVGWGKTGKAALTGLLLAQIAEFGR